MDSVFQSDRDSQFWLIAVSKYQRRQTYRAFLAPAFAGAGLAFAFVAAVFVAEDFAATGFAATGLAADFADALATAFAAGLALPAAVVVDFLDLPLPNAKSQPLAYLLFVPTRVIVTSLTPKQKVLNESIGCVTMHSRRS